MKCSVGKGFVGLLYRSPNCFSEALMPELKVKSPARAGLLNILRVKLSGGIGLFHDLVYRNGQVTFVINTFTIFYNQYLWGFMMHMETFCYLV